MTDYITLSQLNDFLFDPKSLYFHTAFAQYEKEQYHQKAQIEGNIAHQSIDQGTYSNSKRYFLGKSVCSEEYRILGKIDIFDREKHELIERKKRITKIQGGYIAQLYGQYFCMTEMGFCVDKLFLHSLDDNKRYPINKPNDQQTKNFKLLIQQIYEYQNTLDRTYCNDNNLELNTIYNELYY